MAYIYSDDIELTVEKTEKLIPASVSLMLSELTDECKNLLDETVNSSKSDCRAIHKIAKVNSLTDTADKAWQVLMRNFQEFAATDTFKDLTETELQEYIRDEDLNVASEDPVFEAVVTWVKHDMDNRQNRFDGLMEYLTLSHCSLSFLAGVVLNEPLVKSGNCFQNVTKAMQVQATSASLQIGTPRKGYTSTTVEYTVDESKTPNDTLAPEGCGNVVNGPIYSLHWVDEPKRDTLVAVYKNQIWKLHDGENRFVRENVYGTQFLPGSAACSAGDNLFLTGGEVNSKTQSACKEISLSTLDWFVRPDMNHERSNHATVCVGDTVFVLGGDDDCKDRLPMRSVEYLDPNSGRWLPTTDMPEAEANITAVRYRQFIFVFETYDDSKRTFAFDTLTKRWKRRRNMPRYCKWGSSVVYGDRIYVLGGQRRTCMSYDPDQDTWRIHSRCDMKHADATAVVWKDRILVCGGRDESSLIEEYDPVRDTWCTWRYQLPHCINVYVMLAVKL